VKLDPDDVDPLVGRHLRIGWSALLVFGTLGLGLETLHGFKVRWLVDVSNETRRLMWTLAHAHGTLLGLVHIAFAATLRLRPSPSPRRMAIASVCLSAAVLAIPLGFFLGGVFAQAGDPGIAIVLVPAGGVAFLVACAVLAHDALRAQRPEPPGKARTGSRGATVNTKTSDGVRRVK
jgi:hypothetical protein